MGYAGYSQLNVVLGELPFGNLTGCYGRDGPYCSMIYIDLPIQNVDFQIQIARGLGQSTQTLAQIYN